MPNGNLLLVWRQGTDHATTLDGVIYSSISTDGGLTWSAPSLVVSHATLDCRDPSVATMSNGDIVLTWDLWDGSAGVVQVQISSDNAVTWSAPASVNTGMPKSGISAPVVEVNPSLWLMPVYAGTLLLADAIVLKSTDSGITWGSPVTIATGSGISWTEPWITKLSDGRLLCVIRGDVPDSKQYLSYSSDNGATWTAVTNPWTSDSRASTIELTSGALLEINRAVGNQGVFRSSWNLGASWYTVSNLPTPSSPFMYSAVAQLASGRIVGVWGVEVSGISSTLHLVAFTYLP